MIRPAWFRRHRHSDSELDAEIRSHIDEHVERLMQGGMSEAAALTAARRAFGNLSVMTEQSRDVWRWRWAEAIRLDVLYALRLIKRYPAFSVNVILISAIGIAACASTFSLVSGVLFAPLPFAKSDQVFTLELRSADGQQTAAVPVDAYLRMSAVSPVVDGVGAAEPSRALVRWGDEPTEVKAYKITPSFLSVYVIQPVLGRQFTGQDAEHAEPVLMISDALWRSRFHGDRGVIGQTMVLDSVAYTVIGVMPPRFRAHFASEPDVWLPMRVAPVASARNSVNAEVRLRDGVTAAAAEYWLASVAHVRMEASNAHDSVDAKPALVPIRETIYGDVVQPLRILLGSVLLVLLLISANVATMFLGRASARDHELTVRRALGASSARQLAQLITESVVLVGAGGVLGIVASIWTVSAVRNLGEGVLPRLDSVALNWNVVVFAVAATLCTGILGGLPPAIAARRSLQNPNSGARVTGRRASSVLVVSQIALAMMLLVASGLLSKSFMRLLPSEPGFIYDHRIAVMVPTRTLANAAKADGTNARMFVTQVSEQMLRVPGVREVAALSYIPFMGLVSTGQVRLIGASNPTKPYRAYVNAVTPNLHHVLGIPIRRGREILDRDVAGSEAVVVVNEEAATRWWPGEDPVGKQFGFKQGDEERTVTVVGVMGNARMSGRDTHISPEVHVPVAQAGWGYVTLIVNSDVMGAVTVRNLKRAVWNVAPNVPLTNVDELGSFVSKSVNRPRFFSWAMGAFAGVALALSVAAVYGLLTLDVVQRKREIGVRMALGATGSRIGVLVMQRATRLAVLGVLAGALAARALSQYMQSLLVEVSVSDASVFGYTSALALLLAGLAACAPAFRAVKVDPAISLRGD